MAPVWRPEQEEYLLRIRDSCEGLGQYFLEKYKYFSVSQGRFRLPAIILSSVSGVASFGTTTFPKGAQRWVSIVVGGVNIVIAILNTVEAYWKLGDLLSRALTAQMGLKKIADDITCELSVPVEDRTTAGIVFVRDIYARYQQTIEQAPPLDEHHLIQFKKIKEKETHSEMHIEVVDPLPEIAVNASKPSSFMTVQSNESDEDKEKEEKV